MANKNPYMDRAVKRGSNGHGKLSEARVTTTLRAKETPASGAIRGAKGDMDKVVDGTRFKIEAKSTVHDSMKLDLGWLVKIAHEALAVGANPALTVSFVTENGRPRPNGDWVMLPLHLAEEAFDALAQSRNAGSSST